MQQFWAVPRDPQNKPKEMVLHQLLTAEAPGHRKTIAPHQNHYDPLDTMYVAPTCKLPVGGTIKHQLSAVLNHLIPLPLQVHNVTSYQRHLEL